MHVSDLLDAMSLHHFTALPPGHDIKSRAKLFEASVSARVRVHHCYGELVSCCLIRFVVDQQYQLPRHTFGMSTLGGAAPAVADKKKVIKAQP